MPISKNLKGRFLKFGAGAYKELSNNAKLVYLGFVAIHENVNPTNDIMAEYCKMGLTRYKEAKAELIDKGYLYVERFGGKGNRTLYHFGEEAVRIVQEKKHRKV